MLLWRCSGSALVLVLLWRCSGATPNLRTPDRRLSMFAGLPQPSALRLSLRPRTPKLQCCQTTLSSPQNIKFVRVGGTHGWHSLLGPTNQIPELASPAPAAPQSQCCHGSPVGCQRQPYSAPCKPTLILGVQGGRRATSAWPKRLPKPSQHADGATLTPRCGWLAGWLAAWLAAGQLACWLAGGLAGWLVCWLVSWLAGWLAGLLAGWLAGWLAGCCLPAWLAGWVGWLASWLLLAARWLAAWLAGQLAGCLASKPPRAQSTSVNISQHPSQHTVNIPVNISRKSINSNGKTQFRALCIALEFYSE